MQVTSVAAVQNAFEGGYAEKFGKNIRKISEIYFYGGPFVTQLLYVFGKVLEFCSSP